MMMENKQNRPISQGRAGSFRIALWQCRRIRKARHDYDAEREIVFDRVSIRHSRFNRQSNSWENQTIWCSPDEVRDLYQALDAMNDNP